MDRLTGLEVFVSIVEHGGFARAARSLRMSPAMVSTHLARLEERLGSKLLDRTTRRMDLTQQGRRLLDDARSILSALAAAETAVQAGRTAPSGRVRIDAPGAIGSHFIVAAIPAFRALYPRIVLDLSLGDRGQELRPGGFDIIIRVGEETPRGALIWPLSETRFVQVAAPSYLVRKSVPQNPDDLVQHDCILYASTKSSGDHSWQFMRDGGTRQLRPAAVVTLNHGDAISAAAVAGVGIAQTLEMLVTAELADGSLVRVLPDWNPDPVSVFQVSPHDRCDVPAVRAVMEFLANKIDWSSGGMSAKRAHA